MPSRPAPSASRLALAVFLLGALASSVQAQPGAPNPLPAAVQADLDRHGVARVLAELALPEAFQPEQAGTRLAARAQQTAIAASADRALADVAAHAVAVRRYNTVPLLAVTAGADGLRALAASPAVRRLHADRPMRPLLRESGPLVGAPAAWARGFTGQGQTVAVLDTGIDTAHPFLAGRPIEEACFSSTLGTLTQSICPDGTDSQVGAGTAQPCDFTEFCVHGTHVAGIAVGRGEAFSGIAPDAGLLAVQVYARVDDEALCGEGFTPCLITTPSDQIAGLEWVYAQRDRLDIAAVNLSLGGGEFAGACDEEPFRPIIDNLRAAGIATVAASGNDGLTTALNSPACISSAVSVGASGDGSLRAMADAVWEFSNSSPLLDLVAPGIWIESSVPGGGFAAYAGTSLAAPHVAGAWAVLKQERPDASVDDVLARLQATATPIVDARDGSTIGRLQLDAALITTDVAAGPAGGTALHLPMPNPAAADARIGYRLAVPGTVDLSVFDVLGRRVARLDAGPRAAGDHAVTWGASGVAPGLYVVRLAAPDGVRTQTVNVAR